MAKGHKTGGRKAGVPNKVTRETREMILNALDTLGGESYLVEQGQKNPQAFIGLLGKTLPKDVNLKAVGGLKLSISLSRGR